MTNITKLTITQNGIIFIYNQMEMFYYHGTFHAWTRYLGDARYVNYFMLNHPNDADVETYYYYANTRLTILLAHHNNSNMFDINIYNESSNND